MKKSRVYADTSVFGGCFDDEFSEESNTFFQEVKDGKFILVISYVTLRELSKAPEEVKRVLDDLPTEHVEFIEYIEEISILRDAYLSANILGPSGRSDAEHIASASVAEVDFVISWNFNHIVHYDKIIQYQAVNLMNGYKSIQIYSPKEVV